MKLFMVITTAIVIVSCGVRQYDRVIEFNIQSTSDYCEGANPNDEILKKLATPSPFNGILYIHKNKDREDAGITQKFKNGKASISGLVNGKYSIYRYPAIEVSIPENNQPDSSNMSNISNNMDVMMDYQCEIEKAFQPIAIINIDQETTDVSLEIHLECDPCSEPKP
ncbi:hypothetical protein OAP07_04335 [Bacteroidia bacterium]|nr:hypothetical protein [Bacteroidia bacterium]